MKHPKTYFLIIGLVLMVFGFLYDVYFVNIPFQDAPPELLEKYMFHKKVSNVIFYLGIVLMLASIVARFLKSVKK